jgi:hypothetical protein
MQIASIPPPILTASLPQEVANKAVPNVQAVAPLLQSAVNPTAKTDKFRQTRNNQERSKGRGYNRDHPASEEKKDDKDGHSVNFSV